MSKKRITLIVVLVIIIASIVFVTVAGLNLGFMGANIYSVQGMLDAKEGYNKEIESLNAQINKYNQAKNALLASQNEYDTVKSKYDAIDENTIETVKEAQKVEKYWIEYLWVRLDNYAQKHSLKISIVQNGDKAGTTTDNTDKDGQTNQPQSGGTTTTQTTDNTSTDTNTSSAGTSSTSIASDAVRITVTGKYINLTNFIYAIENDESLRFKLDDIQMTPQDSDSVTMSFTVNKISILK